MQPTTTTISSSNEHHPYQTTVFLFGHEGDEPTSGTPFQQYETEPGANRFMLGDDDDDDDEQFILEGMITSRRTPAGRQS